MASPPQRSSFERVRQRKRFPWILGVVASIGFLAILAFVIVTLLILQSQGISRGINTLTVISIIGSFMIGICGLLLSFLQWHHARSSNQPEPAQHSSLQTSTIDSIEHPLSPGSQGGPPQQYIKSTVDLLPPPGPKSHRIDWGEAPHAEQFYGRNQELAKLKRWMIDDHCHLLAILGMGGMGKTTMAATLVGQVHKDYDCVFWRSLHNAPPLESMLQVCILFLSDQLHTAFPAEEDSQIALLIEYFRARRCLLVLDNVESILQGGSRVGYYREGYEGYGKLLQRIGESRHQSCLLITSREKPQEVALLEGEAVAVRSVQLAGLPPVDGQNILKDKGLQGTEDHWEALINHYEGNPLALKLVGQVIREVFGGEITAFLTDGELFFRDIRDVLEQQMERLSGAEEEIVYWLAIEREAITLDDLQEDIVHLVSKGALQEALQSLRRRQLIEAHTGGFTLHHVIMEYLTDRFVDQVCEEIRTGRLLLFERHALLKAQAKDYIRESQRRLILLPLVRRLLAIFGKEALEQQFQSLLATLHAQHDHHPSYTAGNMLNLLIQMQRQLRGYDFSHLVVRQAYLQGVELPEVNFAHADLAKSVFTDTFGSILCVAFSPQGDLLAAGTTTGEIRVWHAISSLPLHTFRGHTNWVHSVAFSPDGKTLASSGDDQIIHLWEVSSGQCFNTLQGHTSVVWSVAFSPDGKTLASSGDDRTVRLWEVSSGQCLIILHGHTSTVWSVAFSPDGKTLASGSADQTVRLWKVSSGQYLNTLRGHTQEVRSVAFSPDGKTLASGSADQMVRLWETSSSQCLIILQGHTSTVWSVAFSPDGKALASSGDDRTVRLWEVSSGQCFTTLQGHTQEVRSVAFNSDGMILASGSADQTVRLWKVSSGECLTTLQGYTQEVRSVAFSPDGKTLASGSADQMVRLWKVESGQYLNTLQGHIQEVRSVAFSPDGKTLASSSADQMVRLWEVSSGQCLNMLQGHSRWVNSVAFSPDGKALASGSDDRTVRLWEVSSGQCLNTLQGHSHWINSVAFSPDGKTLASSSDDQMIHLWEVWSGKLLNTLQGHTSTVRSVVFSPDGKMLASSGDDQTVRLWEVGSGLCLTILQGHTSTVRSVAFSSDAKMLASGGDDQVVRLWETSSGQSLNMLQGHTRVVYSVVFSPDGKTLASGSADQTVRLWKVSNGQCLYTLKSDRPYERMNITQVQGLTEVQKVTLRSLGAIEEERLLRQELA
jgi:WD40 repeat protein